MRAFKFSEVVPPTAHSAFRVQELFLINSSERTFRTRVFISSEASASSTTMSGTKKSASLLSLEDIEMMADKTPKRASITPSVPRSQPPTTRTKSQAQKKRKTSDSPANPFNDLDTHDATHLIRLGLDQIQHQHDDIVQELGEAKSLYASLKKNTEAKDKHHALLTAELEALKDTHAAEMKEMLDKVKKDAAITVYSAKLKMAKEAYDPSFDKAQWNVKSWREVLTRLGGQVDDYLPESEKAEGFKTGDKADEKVQAEVAEDATLGDEGGIEKA